MTLVKNSITIITATYNAGKTLARLMHSIRSQSFKNFEFIVIDGGSDDNTIDIINSNLDLIDYWISEKDYGIYDAWNKGIHCAHGDWIAFIGADDILKSDAIQFYKDTIYHLPNIGINFISAKAEVINEYGLSPKIVGNKWHPTLINVCHVMALHNTSLFDQCGVFNTKYKIVGDYEFLLRCGKIIIPFFVDYISVSIGRAGVSNSISAIKEVYKVRLDTGKLNRLLCMILYLWNVLIFKFNSGLRKY